MFNFSLYPYARWLLDRSQRDGPGFNINEGEVSPGDRAPLGGTLATLPTPQFPSWLQAPGLIVGSQSAPSSDLPSDAPGLRITPGNNLPGFHLNPQDELTNFSLNDDDSSREGTWPGEISPAATPPEYGDSAPTWSLPQAWKTRSKERHRRFLIGFTS